jgi:hypothetical protein
MRQPIIFLSYSHKDERDKDRLATQIKVLERTGKIDLWNDDRIQVGSDWKKDIDEAMAKAKVAILLITANYLTSNFILDVEVPELLERHKKAGLNIFPVIARECAWEEVSWLVEMNVRPKNGNPVWRSAGRYADRELANIAREVASIIKEADRVLPSNSMSVLSTLRGAFRKTVEEAIDSIDAEFRNLKVSRTAINLSAIDALIRITISYGAPLYNQGDIRGCAEIYSHTVRKLVSLIEKFKYRPPMGMMPGLTIPQIMSQRKIGKSLNVERDLGLEFAYSELKQVSTASSGKGYNADKVAWDIRHSFDHVRFIASGINALDTIMHSFNESAEQLGHLTIKVIGLAVAQGGLIYEEGLARDKSWISGSATIYLYTAQKILSLLTTIRIPKDKHSRRIAKIIEARISGVVSVEKFITQDNAYKVAWDIRQAFDSLQETIV